MSSVPPVGGGGGAAAPRTSAMSNTRSLELDDAWWTSTASTLVPGTRRSRRALQSNRAYVLLASWLVDRVVDVTVPDMPARPISVPFRYATKPSSYITSPIIEPTADGSATDVTVVK